jgi:RecA-family ATPase
MTVAHGTWKSGPNGFSNFTEGDNYDRDAMDSLGEPIELSAWRTGLEPPPIVLKVFKANELAKTEAPDREWEVPGIIPAARVTGFCGDGAGGKSLSMLQLGVAQTSGTDWFGKLPRIGKCLILSCEDDVDEVHRRLRDIVEPLSSREDFNVEDLRNLEIIDMVGEDSLLACLDGRSHSIIPTTLYEKIVEHLDSFMGPYLKGSDEGRILVLDTLSKVYGGDENVRIQVTQFVGFLDKLAIKYHTAIILLMHPSLAGMSAGTGSSGSTGWNGSLRARMYLTAVLGEKGEETDPCLRQLKVMKNNYGPAGETIQLRWENGRYVLVAGGSASALTNDEIDSLFLDLLKQFAREGRNVVVAVGPSYAPAEFSKHADGKHISKEAFRRSMDRLLKKHIIKSLTYGPPSRLRNKLILADEIGSQTDAER